MAPNLFELDSDGYALDAEVVFGPDLEEAARLGAASCPERAITIES